MSAFRVINSGGDDLLSWLAECGLKISIDDFGTGYSSLALLRRLPLHGIKIDRSFVRAMTSDHDDAVIVRSTIELAHNLGLKVIAEGVATSEIYDELVRLGCDAAQGFYLGAALPAREIALWLEDHERSAPAAATRPGLPKLGASYTTEI